MNTILFEQLSALNDEGADFEKEIRKSYAVSQIAQQIIANTNTCIKCKVSLSRGEGKPEWGAEAGVEYYILNILSVEEVE